MATDGFKGEIIKRLESHEWDRSMSSRILAARRAAGYRLAAAAASVVIMLSAAVFSFYGGEVSYLASGLFNGEDQLTSEWTYEADVAWYYAMLE
ncbi:MAG: hypothetical protein MUD12_13075 [Spirochaetes bacterium]|jgi:hypothetical protein|nr:hypothetical protein [Spirochaetota bacterium]